MPSSNAAVAARPPPVATSGYSAPARVRRLSVGGRPVLFDAVRQQLLELNEAADAVWRALAAGGEPEDAARALAALGVASGEAESWVAHAADGWLRQGFLVPRAMLETAAGTPRAVRHLGLDELRLELSFFGDADPGACDAVFGHLQAPAADTPRRLAAVGHGGLVFFLLDGAPQGATGAEGVVPRIKAVFTDLYANGVEAGFLCHAACLNRSDRALLLIGAPGAGKTTLTLALAARGWRYGGDDIVRFDARGQVRGAPFSAAVKAGGWALAQPHAPEVAALPTHLRDDGQQVRYWRPDALAERRPGPLGAVVLLARTPGAAARLEPVEPLAALSAILEGAYAARWRLDGDAMDALAAAVDAADRRRLVYDGLAGAAAALDALDV